METYILYGSIFRQYTYQDGELPIIDSEVCFSRSLAIHRLCEKIYEWIEATFRVAELPFPYDMEPKEFTDYITGEYVDDVPEEYLSDDVEEDTCLIYNNINGITYNDTNFLSEITKDRIDQSDFAVIHTVGIAKQTIKLDNGKVDAHIDGNIDITVEDLLPVLQQIYTDNKELVKSATQK